MTPLFTPTNILAVLGIVGFVFGMYKGLTGPQINSDKRDALMQQEIKGLTEKLQLLMNNDLHEIKGMLERQTARFIELAVQVGKLETKVDERIPKKE